MLIGLALSFLVPAGNNARRTGPANPVTRNSRPSVECMLGARDPMCLVREPLQGPSQRFERGWSSFTATGDRAGAAIGRWFSEADQFIKRNHGVLVARVSFGANILNGSTLAGWIAGEVLGGKCGMQGDSLQIYCSEISSVDRVGACAITIGNTVLIRDDELSHDLRQHEGVHGGQWAVLGPGFVPFWAIDGTIAYFRTGNASCGLIEFTAGHGTGGYHC